MDDNLEENFDFDFDFESLDLDFDDIDYSPYIDIKQNSLCNQISSFDFTISSKKQTEIYLIGERIVSYKFGNNHTIFLTDKKRVKKNKSENDKSSSIEVFWNFYWKIILSNKINIYFNNCSHHCFPIFKIASLNFHIYLHQKKKKTIFSIKINPFIKKK